MPRCNCPNVRSRKPGAVQPAHRPSDDGSLCRSVPSGLVRGIHVEPNTCYPHDTHTQNTIHPKPRLIPSNDTYFHRYLHIDLHTLHRIWQVHRFATLAPSVFRMAGTYDFLVYGFSHVFEESVYTALWGVVVV